MRGGPAGVLNAVANTTALILVLNSATNCRSFFFATTTTTTTTTTAALIVAPSTRGGSSWKKTHHTSQTKLSISINPYCNTPWLPLLFPRHRSLLLSSRDTGDDRGRILDDDDDDEEGISVEHSSATPTPIGTRTLHTPVVESAEPITKRSSTSATIMSNLVAVLQETNRKMDKQQEQMDRLIPLLEALVAGLNQRRGDIDNAADPSIWSSGSQQQQQQQQQHKQRAVLFIDGTWLYYSIYEREMESCPFARLYGRSWALRYDINWKELLRLLSAKLGEDISRACVFTSYKADTSPASFRYKMFEAMKSSGYDVYMMETVGRSEKCVDIQIATELLQSSCDVAVILTGDKDFLPAMIRARKNKKLALVSMRRSCNRALYDETTTALDYDVMWLDDIAGQLVTPKDNLISVFTVCKILIDYIKESPISDRVSSRDVGRYLKFVRIGSLNLGDQVKLWGGYKQFFSIVDNMFFTDDDTFAQGDPNDASYWIGLQRGAEAQLLFEAKQTTFTPAEKQFFDDSYSLSPLENKGRAYGHTLLLANPGEGHQNDLSIMPFIELPDDLKRDYSILTVSELKEECRERELPVSGVKAALLERVEADVRREIKALELTKMQQLKQPPSVQEDVAKYLEDLICEYVKASGGSASSRDVGRYLAASKSSTGDSGMTALQELKSNYGGGLLYFLQQRPNVLEKSDDPLPEEEGIYAFTVRLVKKGVQEDK